MEAGETNGVITGDTCVGVEDAYGVVDVWESYWQWSR